MKDRKNMPGIDSPNMQNWKVTGLTLRTRFFVNTLSSFLRPPLRWETYWKDVGQGPNRTAAISCLLPFRWDHAWRPLGGRLTSGHRGNETPYADFPAMIPTPGTFPLAYLDSGEAVVLFFSRGTHLAQTIRPRLPTRNKGSWERATVWEQSGSATRSIHLLGKKGTCSTFPQACGLAGSAALDSVHLKAFGSSPSTPWNHTPASGKHLRPKEWPRTDTPHGRGLSHWSQLGKEKKAVPYMGCAHCLWIILIATMKIAYLVTGACK